MGWNLSGIRRSIVLDGRVTSLQLEGAFWDYLDRLADDAGLSWAEFARHLLVQCQRTDNRASSIKQALLKHAVEASSAGGSDESARKAQRWQLSYEDSVVTVLTPWKLLRLGRRPDCELALSDPECSKIHAAMFPVAGCWWIADLASKNGLWQDGERIKLVALRLGDAVTAGKTEIRLLN